MSDLKKLNWKIIIKIVDGLIIAQHRPSKKLPQKMITKRKNRPGSYCHKKLFSSVSEVVPLDWNEHSSNGEAPNWPFTGNNNKNSFRSFIGPLLDQLDFKFCQFVFKRSCDTVHCSVINETSVSDICKHDFLGRPNSTNLIYSKLATFGDFFEKIENFSSRKTHVDLEKHPNFERFEKFHYIGRILRQKWVV